MKNIIIATLSTCFLAMSAPSTSAQQIYLFNSSRFKHTNESEQVRPTRQLTAKSQLTNTNISEPIPPVTLVQLGSQGYFSQQGIPSNAAFRFAIKTGKVDAQKLVQSAIDKGRLSSEALNDTEYLSSVQFQLHRFNRF